MTLTAFTGIKDIKPHEWSAVGNGDALFDDIYIGNYGTRFIVSFRRKDGEFFLVQADCHKLNEQELQDFADDVSGRAKPFEIVMFTQHL